MSAEQLVRKQCLQGTENANQNLKTYEMCVLPLEHMGYFLTPKTSRTSADAGRRLSEGPWAPIPLQHL